MPQQVEFPHVEIENENGWGPSVPLENLVSLPLVGYAAKNDSLFQVADWYNTRRVNRRDMNNTVNKEFESLKQDKDFNFVASEIKKKKTTRKTYTSIQKARAARTHQRENGKLRREANRVETGARSFGGFAQARRNKWQKRRNAQYKARQQAKHENQFKFEQSVQVQSTWGHKDDKWLPDMKEWQYELNEDSYKVTRLAEIGRCKVIRPRLNKIRVDKPKVLKHRSKARRKYVSTLKDEVLQMHEASGDIFITSEILAALMACPRSKMSWDIFVTKKEDGKLWFDMRPECPLQRPQPDEGVAKIIIKDAVMEKYMQTISQESEVMDRSFFHFTLDPKKEAHVGADSAGRPLESENSTICRYNRYELSNYTVICRCSFDAIDEKGDPVIVATATQHHPSKSYNNLAWNKDLDVKFAAAKTAVINNNKFQFARWGIEMILAGAQSIVLGFVSRTFPANGKDHQILKVLTMGRDEYVKRWCLSKSMANSWGIFDQLVQYFKDDEIKEGKYCILRDANKERLSFYKVEERTLDESFV